MKQTLSRGQSPFLVADIDKQDTGRRPPDAAAPRPKAGLAPTVLAWAMLCALPSPAGAADLEVAAHPVRSGEGTVKLMLFEREEGFRKEDKARQVLSLPAGPGTVVGRFGNLPPGRYAVIAYHDENGDGKLNLRFGMFPKEGYGLSNNPKLSGPPKFADAALDLPESGRRIDVRLDY